MDFDGFNGKLKGKLMNAFERRNDIQVINTFTVAQLSSNPSESLLIRACILVDGVLTAPQLLWEVLAMLFVRR